jgi:hypothetical protein
MKRPTIEQIKARIENLKTSLFRYMDNGNSNHPSGAAHFYYKVNAKWGVKFLRPYAGRSTICYQQREQLYACRMRQELAAKQGLAPPVGDVVEVVVCDVEYVGFITAHAYTNESWDDKRTYRQGGCLPQEARDFFVAHENNEEELKDQLSTLFGFEMYDSKPANCGMFEGKLVCIDFGREGFSSVRKSKYFPDS